ncbi:DUF423 domain-containing protein [Lutibacter holmesii]|uniref:DUF423 domain-containing protein n=1 Tax=Lutibacter holmesii TaxID=1137985 RepID=A0ABW3WPT1_9FLAO
MNKILSVIAFLGAITIVLGAFGAHSLEKILSETALKSFETAVRYQMYHVLMLLVVNSLAIVSNKSKKIISTIILFGIACFSGSIYAIAFGVEAKQIWFITPFGGLLLIVGWIVLGISCLKGVKMN